MKSILTLLVFFNLIAHANETDLTAFLIPPTSYKQTPETLEKAFPDNAAELNFLWLDEKKTRASFKRNRGEQFNPITILDGKIPIEEMTIDFKDGRYEGSSVSIFNRENDSKMSTEQEIERTNQISDLLTKVLQTSPRKRIAHKAKVILTNGLVWQSPRGMAVLEHNVGPPQQREFVRLRIGHYLNEKGIYVTGMNDQSRVSISKSQLKENIIKNGKSVYIDNIPMIDQTAKGYLIAANIQRLFEYYGIHSGIHQLAEIMKSTAQSSIRQSTTDDQIEAACEHFKIDCNYITFEGQLDSYFPSRAASKEFSIKRSEFSIKRIEFEIRKSIDKGRPILWAVYPSLYQEFRPSNNQSNCEPTSDRIKIVIGYNIEDRILYFSDSCGVGDERKLMDLDDALSATQGFFLINPDID